LNQENFHVVELQNMLYVKARMKRIVFIAMAVFFGLLAAHSRAAVFSALTGIISPATRSILANPLKSQTTFRPAIKSISEINLPSVNQRVESKLDAYLLIKTQA
jgi:hypothetical protein